MVRALLAFRFAVLLCYNVNGAPPGSGACLKVCESLDHDVLGCSYESLV